MTTIVDRRKNGKGKSSTNRQKFLKRIKSSIKEAMPDILDKKSVKDIGESGGNINISRRKLSEPSFRHGKGGIHDIVVPGNKEFTRGDRIPKPKGGGEKGSGGSKDGEGEDDFIVEITREEFLDYFFEDLELPDLVKKDLSDMTETKRKNAGWSSDGSPSKLSVLKSVKQSKMRRIGLSGKYRRELKAAKEERNEIYRSSMSLPDPFLLCDDERLIELEELIEVLKRKIDAVPYLDPVDLRYHSMATYQVPSTQAVMFCIMDNSGSMGPREKTISRKFFTLLYLFLKRRYEKIELVFIHHTTAAREVSEEEFFSTRENGGTVVSTALDLVADIIKEKYAGKSNVYICQCSDGDNWDEDNGTCYEIMTDDIMPEVQYFAYLQIMREGSGEEDEDVVDRGRSSGLWGSYKMVGEYFQNFAQKKVFDESDIYPVFRALFEKKDPN